MAMCDFLASGKDGYEPFKNGVHLIDLNTRKSIRAVIIDFLSIVLLDKGMPQHLEFYKEFQLFKKHEDFMNLIFIRDLILTKICHQEEANKAVSILSSNPDEHKSQRDLGSFSDHMIVKVLSDNNIEAVLRKDASLTLECLVR